MQRMAKKKESQEEWTPQRGNEGATLKYRGGGLSRNSQGKKKTKDKSQHCVSCKAPYPVNPQNNPSPVGEEHREGE